MNIPLTIASICENIAITLRQATALELEVIDEKSPQCSQVNLETITTVIYETVITLGDAGAKLDTLRQQDIAQACWDKQAILRAINSELQVIISNEETI